MKAKKKKKQAVTLIEIMIVILLIGLIGGALAFNMRGSMEKGKLFKTEQNCNRIYDALMMANANGDFDLENCKDNDAVQEALDKSPLIKDPKKILKDAWGKDITIKRVGGDDIAVTSLKAESIKNGKKK